MLVAAGFDQQITTTVLWLGDVYGLDIRCVKLVPYRVDHRLLLDVQQVIPLPEAEELMVRLRRRETAARAAEDAVSGRDWTQYVITGPTGDSQPLRKRHAILEVVQRLHQAGVPAIDRAGAIPGSRFLPVEGVYRDTDLAAAFVARYPRADGNLRRWHIDSPIADDGRTWVLSKQWEPTLFPPSTPSSSSRPTVASAITLLASSTTLNSSGGMCPDPTAGRGPTTLVRRQSRCPTATSPARNPPSTPEVAARTGTARSPSSAASPASRTSAPEPLPPKGKRP